MTHPDVEPLWRSVVGAIGYLADDCVECDADIKTIAKVAGVSRNVAIAALDWMLAIGAIEEVKDTGIRTGRRLGIAWRRGSPAFRPHPRSVMTGQSKVGRSSSCSGPCSRR